MGRTWQRVKDLMGTWGLAILIVLAGLAATYQFVDPAPPGQVTLATGQEGGAYHEFGKAYARHLANQGITVELRPTAGSVENLQLLASDSGVDLAFVQSGLAGDVPVSQVMSLGAMAFEPLWLFLRVGLQVETLGDLAGSKIVVGSEGSGTRVVAVKLLAANGVGPHNAQLLDLDYQQSAGALSDGAADAVFLVASPASDVVRELIEVPGVRLYGFGRTGAYVRVYRFLSPVVIPEGVLNLARNLPAETVQTVAPAATLAAREDFHPALVDLLLIAAADIHGQGDLVSDPGQFPTPEFTDLPLSDDAQRHYRYGPPFLQRILPFWAATLVDRLKIMLLPLIGLAIPLAKLMPPLYRWRIRSRIFRMYEDVIALDPVNSDQTAAVDVAERLKQLDGIETEAAHISVPLSYADELYELRRDIDLIRRKLVKLGLEESSGADRSIGQADA